MTKNNSRILKTNVYFQPGLKALVKFQNDRPKTVGVARHGAYSLYSSVVLGSKMPELKIWKRAKKKIPGL